MPKNRQYSIQLIHQIRQHFIINIPIPGERTTALDVAGEGRDEVRVLDQFGHQVCDSGLLEDCLDADVVPFRGVERQELITWKTGIPVDNFLRHAVQWNNHYARILLDGLCRDVLYRPVDDIALLRANEVTDTASYIALKDEDVSLYC